MKDNKYEIIRVTPNQIDVIYLDSGSTWINIVKLLLMIFVPPLLPYHISKMMFPDVDYWAQKSTQRQVNKDEHIKTSFYSVQTDTNLDGFVDSQINFEQTDVSIDYEVIEFKKTILAAKYQNILTVVGQYMLSTLSALFLDSDDDFVFNEFLTEEHLETQDFSNSNLGAILNAPYLAATYRKFTENITTTYTDSFERSTLTIIDFEEGEIQEQRIYEDDFNNNDVYSAEGFFEDLSYKHSVTVVDSGAQATIRFDPELPYAHPANISWKGKTWGPDNVPVKYDSLETIGSDYTTTENFYEKPVILRIPNRFSVYNDMYKTASPYDNGWVEFEAEGMFITPADGQVYYTSDAEAFKEGTATTRGHYFYVDSDLNGFYETVYVISDIYTLSKSGVPKYDVISIGLNYDGMHDFVPYEKLGVSVSVSDFDNLARESRMFGTDWIYNFNNLRRCKLLFKPESEKDIMDEYKPKDQIFEIHKLVDRSKNNPKHSELFYEIRQQEYDKAWIQFKAQLTRDIVEQVFMSTTAALLSAAVDAYITAAITAGTLGFGALAAKTAGQIAGTLTYVTVYTLMTKISIDVKLHEARSKERSETFYPVSTGVEEPTSLNERSFFDRILKDSMVAAIIGHPGGYYTTVSGMESGETYTGNLLVSPPNFARLLGMFGGFIELLWENIWNMGGSDPDTFTALDFDNFNLDFLLMTSELPLYNTNHYPYHTYINTEFIFDVYNQYSFNTLGALETLVRKQSSSSFDAIRPTCINGVPQYEFINSTTYETILPQSILYRPIVLNQTSYDQIKPVLGYLSISVRCEDYGKTYGVNAYNLNAVESSLYKAKVPINDNGFEYPVRYVYIDVVQQDDYSTNYFAQNILVNESNYHFEGGSLYFNKSIEALVSEKYPLFGDFLSQSWADTMTDSTIYYNIRIVFERFVPDTDEETNKMALAQATSYTIMDYFNQYTYAQITANMIGEIAYTETLTFWSTLISAPLIYFGSWAVGSQVGKAFGEAGQKAVMAGMQKSVLKGILGIVYAPIKETFEEIVKDSFIEAISEWIADIAGLPDAWGYLISAAWQSKREVSGALGQLAGVGGTKLSSITNLISLMQALSSGDIGTILEINQELETQQANAMMDQEQSSFWSKLLQTDLLKGIFMVAGSVFLGSFGFTALSGLGKTISSAIQLSPSAQAIFLALRHNKRKKDTIKAVGTEGANSVQNVLIDHLKKPSELDNVKPDVQTEFNSQQESQSGMPFNHLMPHINSNPNTNKRDVISDKFFKGRFNDWVDNYLLEEERFKAFKAEFKQIQHNYEKIGVQNAESEAIAIIKEALKGDNVDLRFLNMFGVELYDPNYIIIGKKLGPQARSGGSRQWSDNIGARETTLDKLTEIKRYFDISSEYKMYILDGNNKIEIPVNDETFLRNWLETHHYSADSKIFVVPSSLTTEEFHTYDNWKDHPTYVFYQDMKALLTNRDPDQVTAIELSTLLGQSRSIYVTVNNHLKDGLNDFYGDNILYKWLYNIDENELLTKDIKDSFRDLVMNYRKTNGLTYQDPHVETLVGELRLAIQHEPNLVTAQGPSNRKLLEFFGLPLNSEVFSGSFRTDSLLKLIYGLYRKSSDKFILANLGKSRISDDMGMSLAAKKAMLAISKYSVSKNFLTNLELKPLQKIIILISWYASDIHHEGGYLNLESIAILSNIPSRSLNSYISGKITQTRDVEVINNLEELVSILSITLRKNQYELLKQAYDVFYAQNEDTFPGIHGIRRQSEYTKDWFYPQVVAKHIVELLLRQGGLLPAGRRGEGAENYNILDLKNRHHIDFNKLSKDVKNLILLGRLHSRFTRLEKANDVGYKNLMRGFRDDFEAARPLSIWDVQLQDKYIERLKEFVTEWESTKSSIRYTDSKTGEKVDFIKIIYRGTTYNIQKMLRKGWITKDFVDNIITDIRQKLESRGLM